MQPPQQPPGWGSPGQPQEWGAQGQGQPAAWGSPPNAQPGAHPPAPPRRRLWPFVLLAVIVCCLLCGSSIVALALWGDSESSQQTMWTRDLADLDRQIAQLPRSQRAPLQAERNALVARYVALPPSGDARNQARRSIFIALRDLRTRVDGAVHAQNAAADAVIRQQLVGTWNGSGATLVVSPTGHVSWHRQNGAVSTNVDGELGTVDATHFDVSVFGVATTFHLDQPPHLSGANWQMTVDGVAMARAN